MNLNSPEVRRRLLAKPRLLDEYAALFGGPHPAAAIELSEKPSPSPGASGNRGASPKQLAFQAAFFAQRHRIYAASGANQSGKTEAVAGLCFCKWLRDRAQDGDIYWVVARSAETIRDIPHRSLWRFLPKSMFEQGVAYQPKLGFGSISTLKLNLDGRPGSCEVWFKTEEQDLKSFESSRVNGVWWTECEREALMDAIVPRLAARRGWLLMDYVPTHAWHKFRLRLPAESGDVDLVHTRFCMRDNAHNLPPGEIDFQSRRMTQNERRIRVEGEDGAAFGVVFPEFSPTRHTCEPFPIPAEWPKWRMLDYGYRNPTAVLWIALAPAGFCGFMEERGYVYREFFQSGSGVPATSAYVKQMSTGEKYRKPILVDPTIYNRTEANQLTIAEQFQAAGLDIMPAIRTSSVGEHALVAKVRKWIDADKIVYFKTCVNGIREVQSWRYKENKDGQVAGNEPFEDKDNHTVDDLRYWVADDPTFTTSQGSRQLRRAE